MRTIYILGIMEKINCYGNQIKQYNTEEGDTCKGFYYIILRGHSKY